MENYDSEDDFCLTQTPLTSYEVSNSASFGNDIILENYNGGLQLELVSLECGIEQPNFDLGCDLIDQTQKKYVYDNVEIEDISSDEEVDGV